MQGSKMELVNKRLTWVESVILCEFQGQEVHLYACVYVYEHHIQVILCVRSSQICEFPGQPHK